MTDENVAISALDQHPIAFYLGRFCAARVSGGSGSAKPVLSLVEIPMHDGLREPQVVHLSADEADAALVRGDLYVLSDTPPYRKPIDRETAPTPRPYPFEGGKRRTPPRRGSDASQAALAELRRQGLIMTGAEYVRLLEARRRRGLGKGRPDRR